MKPDSQHLTRQRRFYLVLPLLVLPFVTLLFWALGGGQGSTAAAMEMSAATGLNLELPGAHFDAGDELWDKFALYEQAKRDSVKYEQARRNDPYYVVTTLTAKERTDTLPRARLNTSLGEKDQYTQLDENEALIQQKLQQLTRSLEQPEKMQPYFNGTKPEEIQKQDTPESGEVDRLEKMMELMAGTDTNDPEMQQIESVLDKLLDVQHPERVREKIREQSSQHKQQVFPVQAAPDQDNISIVEPVNNLNSLTDSLSSLTAYPRVQNAFYGLDDEIIAAETTANAIQAVVHDTQELVTGATVRLRLLTDVFINGVLIPKDQFVYGTCSIQGERLLITINSVRQDNSLLPVAMSVYDLDGLQGIYIPGAITREAAKQATSQSIQDVQLYSMDSSLGVQAATAGIEAAKGLFSKKVKLIKVTVKAGYQILLKDTNADS